MKIVLGQLYIEFAGSHTKGFYGRPMDCLCQSVDLSNNNLLCFADEFYPGPPGFNPYGPGDYPFPGPPDGPMGFLPPSSGPHMMDQMAGESSDPVVCIHYL